MNLEIDLEVNEWVKDVEDLNKIGNSYLKLGYIVSNLIQSNLKLDTSLFEPINKTLDTISNKNQEELDKVGVKINENLDYLKQSIDKLTQYTNKSVSKGFYGEKYIEELLNQYFPDYTIINNTHNPHKSDFEIQNNKLQKIMVEVKNYQNTVPTSEVQKFIDDLEKSDIQVGIFISLNSAISLKKRFQIDITESGKKMIFLPNIKEDYSIIIMSILMSESLLTIDLNPNCKINQNNLMIIYEELQEFNKHYINIIENVKKSKNSIDKTLQIMMQNLIEEDIKMKTYFKSIQTKINTELVLIQSNFETKNNEELINIIEKIHNKKNKSIYYDIYNWCNEKNLSINVNDIDELFWDCCIFNVKSNTKKVIITYEENEINVSNFELIKNIFVSN